MSQFERTEKMIGKDKSDSLHRKRIAVFGVGGVGGFAVEALARAGIGELDIFDSDDVNETNINRQIIALHSTIGRKKVEVFKERILDINPDAIVNTYPVFYLPENADDYSLSKYDYIIDAIDTVTAKLELICRASKAGVPIISACGAGNKLDPTGFRVADIYKTKVCPLAKVLRKELKARGIDHLKCVYSEELPVLNERVPASISFVPSVMGLILAGEVIKDLAELF